jgi:ketopantoate reductase
MPNRMVQMSKLECRIQIIGTGAIGSFLAQALSPRVLEVSFVDPRLSLSHTSNHTFMYNNNIFSFPQRSALVSSVDWVFVALKSYHITSEFLETIITKDANLVFLQNGLMTHRKISESGINRTFANFSAIEADFVDNQLLVKTTEPALLVSKEILSLQKQNQLVDIFEMSSVGVYLLDNYSAVLSLKYPRWLLVNLLTIIYNGPIGYALAEIGFEKLEKTIEEVSMLLGSVVGFSIDKVDLLKQLQDLPYGLITSSYRDFYSKKQCEFLYEVEYLLGEAEKLGISCPIFQQIVRD